MDNNEVLFTPASLLDFLRQIDELSNYDINVFDNEEFALITIGSSQYRIDYNNAQDVEVPGEVVDEVTDIVEETYDELGAEGEIEFHDVQNVSITNDGQVEEIIEGGVISELLKTLAVGGMVRLTGKVLGDDFKK